MRSESIPTVKQAMDPKCSHALCGMHCGHNDWSAPILRAEVLRLQSRLEKAEKAVRHADKFCPCGSRGYTSDRPHVLDCPVGRAMDDMCAGTPDECRAKEDK